MSAQFQNKLPHSRSSELQLWLLVDIQSTLLGAHALGHEGGSNSSYPGDLQPLPESWRIGRIKAEVDVFRDVDGDRVLVATEAQKPHLNKDIIAPTEASQQASSAALFMLAFKVRVRVRVGW